MARRVISAIITNAMLAPSYSQVSQTILQGQDPSQKFPAALSGTIQSYDVKLPVIISGRNIMPTVKGMKSVLVDLVDIFSPPLATFWGTLEARTYSDLFGREYSAFFRPSGAYVLYDNGGGYSNWNYIAYAAASGPFTTFATINGRSYHHGLGTAPIALNAARNGFDAFAPTFPAGITTITAKGYGSCGNYLLAFMDQTIYWSSPLNIWDFVTLDAGAGQQVPLDLQGRIKFILPIQGGSVIYTTVGAIAMRLTNNAASPFAFTAIPGSCGLPDLVAQPVDVAADAHYVLTNQGYQKVTLRGAEFFAEHYWNIVCAGEITQDVWPYPPEALSSSANGVSKITALGRYVFVSHDMSGAGPAFCPIFFRKCAVFDTVLQRWGSLEVNHCSIVPIPTAPLNYSSSRKVQLFHFVGSEVYASDFSEVNGADETQVNSMIRLGHFQETRGRSITIHKVSVSGMTGMFNGQLMVQCSESGMARDGTLQVFTLKNPRSSPVGNMWQTAEFEGRVTGKNADVLIQGGFAITDVTLEYTVHGSR